MKFDWLIVGSGFTGATLAERIASQLNQTVLMVDRRNHVGGNAFDEYNDVGIQVHKFGPHIFHTNSKEVFGYLSQFTNWRPYMHQVLGMVEGCLVPVPFNLNSLRLLFPIKYAEKLEEKLVETYGIGVKVPILKMMETTDPEIKFLGDYIYKNVFEGYTRKQWDLKPEQLDASVTGRVPVFISKDDRYFQDTYQAMPINGYTAMFNRMLSHKNIKILLNTDYREIMDSIKFNRMIYTGPVDEFFDFSHGKLPYRSLRFEFIDLPYTRHQAVGTVNYPNNFDFTRITEQSYLSGQKMPQTTLIYEYPQIYDPKINEPYYPIPRPESREIYNQYELEIQKLETVIFAGRLADYKYYNMDQACARALKVFQDLTESTWKYR